MDIEDLPRVDVGRSFPWRLFAGVFFVISLLIGGFVVLLSSCFKIEPDEVGVVLHFGEHVRIAEPGINFKLPFPVEEVIKIPIHRQLNQEFGFRSARKDGPTADPDGNPTAEALMLTADLDVVMVEWVAHYRITDPAQYLFNVRGVTESFRDMNEVVMRAAVGDRSIDEVITFGRGEIQDEVELRLQELCDRHESGIAVDQVVLVDVKPPEGVRHAFEEVNQARQDRERVIRNAREASAGAPAGGGS